MNDPTANERAGHAASTMDEGLVSRYLRALGVSRAAPSLEALRTIVAGHLYQIPFENISKLWRHRKGEDGVPDIATFLDGVERFHFGGTCYANNYHLYRLLISLGYEAKLHAADMVNPGVHMVVAVRLDGREYLLDVGYGAPFLEPMPRDLPRDFVISAEGDHYILHPRGTDGSSRMELYRGDELKHFYVVRREPRTLADFSEVIAQSFRAEAMFMKAILLTRFSAGHSVIIHNLTSIERRGNEPSEKSVANREELPALVEHHFGIPKHIVVEAIKEVGELQDAWN